MTPHFLTARHRVPALLVPLAALAAACGGKTDDEGEAAAVAPVVGARTVVVAARPFTETVLALGSVRARAGHLAALGAPVASRVTRVLVSVGDRVSVGQPLVVLDASVLSAAAGGARATVTAAQQAADRAQRLFAQGIVARREVDQATAELARARADLAGAQQQVALATLRAPIAGVVTSLRATLGATADAAQPLVEIADPSAIEVVLGVTPADAARIRRGATVSIRSDDRPGSPERATATVSEVAATVDSAGRTVQVRARPSGGPGSLRIGETIYASIAVATRGDALVVPAEALVPSGDGFAVFVVDSQQIAHARTVTVGARVDSLVEITEGLTAGTRVVTYGAYGVSDSARIVPPATGGRAPAAPSGGARPRTAP